MKKEETAFLLARLPIGFSFLGHGLVRLPKLQSFAEGMSNSFADTILPGFLVFGFGFILPIVELIIGVLLIAGSKIKSTTIAGVLLMCMLIFGSSLLESWSSVATQMFYGLYFSILYLYSDHNISLLNLKK